MNDTEECERCEGTGEVRKWHNEGEDWIDCDECGGTGEAS